MNAIIRCRIYFFMGAFYLLGLPGILYLWINLFKDIVANHENLLWLPMPLLALIGGLSYIFWKLCYGLLSHYWENEYGN